MRMLHVTTGRQGLWKKIKSYGDSVAFSPDGERFATAAEEEGTAGIWDASTGELLLEVGNVGRVTAVAFSPDGRLLATSADDGVVRISDARTGQFLLKVRHGSGVTAVAFSPDSGLLASSSDDGSARIWDASTGQQQCCLPHGEYVGHVAFSPDGNFLATSSVDGTIRIWDKRAWLTRSASPYRSLDVPDDAPADQSPAVPEDASTDPRRHDRGQTKAGH
jgi:WD40 repeat protein